MRTTNFYASFFFNIIHYLANLFQFIIFKKIMSDSETLRSETESDDSDTEQLIESIPHLSDFVSVDSCIMRLGHRDYNDHTTLNIGPDDEFSFLFEDSDTNHRVPVTRLKLDSWNPLQGWDVELFVKIVSTNEAIFIERVSLNDHINKFDHHGPIGNN